MSSPNPDPVSRPLTPAEVEVLEQWLEDREARMVETMNAAIAAAVANCVQYGQRIGLRTHAGVTLCLDEGGPEAEGEPITFESRTGVGPWESFTVERGQA